MLNTTGSENILASSAQKLLSAVEIVRNCSCFLLTLFECCFTPTDYSHRKRMHPKELTKKLQEKEISEHRLRTAAQSRRQILK